MEDHSILQLGADFWRPISEYRAKHDVVLVWREGRWPVAAWRSGRSGWRMVGIERQLMPYIPTHFCSFELPSCYQKSGRGSKLQPPTGSGEESGK